MAVSSWHIPVKLLAFAAAITVRLASLAHLPRCSVQSCLTHYARRSEVSQVMAHSFIKDLVVPRPKHFLTVALGDDSKPESCLAFLSEHNAGGRSVKTCIVILILGLIILQRSCYEPLFCVAIVFVLEANVT